MSQICIATDCHGILEAFPHHMYSDTSQLRTTGGTFFKSITRGSLRSRLQSKRNSLGNCGRLSHVLPEVFP